MDGGRRFAPAGRITLILLIGVTLLAGVGASGASADKGPNWIKHVKHWDGGISNGVRERLAQASGDIVVSNLQATRERTLPVPALDNVQMNGDSDPPLPQDEPSIAASLDAPMNAVAASNDYTGDGFWIGYTTDGGQTWTSQWKDPKFSFDGSRCFASDPSVAYSLRDHAFYLSTLCYFTTTPASEVQVWKSVDGGATWSSSLEPALVVTNHAPNGSIDASIFNDKELMAVDNSPSSPHFGRIYVTWTKFHMTGGSFARSDYCPVQAAYTDLIPTNDPSNSVWARTAIVPDAPGAGGVGASANQFSTPVVDEQGGLDVAFVQEDCNSSIDHALFFARSTNGGLRSVRSCAWTSQAGSPTTRTPTTTCPGRATCGSRTRSRWRTTRPATGSRSSIRTTPIAPSLARTSRCRPPTTSGRRGPSRSPSASDRTVRPPPATSSSRRSAWTRAASGSRSGRTPGSIRSNHLISTFQGGSTDGGATWTNDLISTASFDARKSFFTCGCFIGDYNQISVSDDLVLPVWTDGRDSPPKPAGDSNVWTNVEIRT